MKNPAHWLALAATALLVGGMVRSIYHHPVTASATPTAQDVAAAKQLCPPPSMPEAAHQAGEHGRCKILVSFNTLRLPAEAGRAA